MGWCQNAGTLLPSSHTAGASQIMRAFLLALLVWMPVAAGAATPEQDYIAARDKFIAKFTKLTSDDKFDDAVADDHKRALDELEKLLERVIGPVAVNGFATKGTINLDGLVKGDEGFGLLDALVYLSREDKGERTARVIVASTTLLDRWIKEHKSWWGPKANNVPQNAAAAIKTEAFYTQGISADSAVSRYVEIPVTKPAAAKSAYAMLAVRTQTDGPQLPDELIVSALYPTRLYIVSAPVAATIEPIAACEEIWQEYVRKSEEAIEAQLQSQRGQQDESKPVRRAARRGRRRVSSLLRAARQGSAVFRRACQRGRGTRRGAAGQINIQRKRVGCAKARSQRSGADVRTCARARRRARRRHSASKDARERRLIAPPLPTLRGYEAKICDSERLLDSRRQRSDRKRAREFIELLDQGLRQRNAVPLTVGSCARGGPGRASGFRRLRAGVLTRQARARGGRLQR